jgi:ABC-type sugar transport system ATPase subunit
LKKIIKARSDVRAVKGRRTAGAARSIGAGRSTILRLPAGLEAEAYGMIRIGDRDTTHLAPASRNACMVFQSYACFPMLIVVENIVFGLKSFSGIT